MIAIFRSWSEGENEGEVYIGFRDLGFVLHL